MKRFASVCFTLLSLLLVAGVCYADSPQVDVQTGMVTNGPLVENQPFVWVNRAQTSCSVTDNSAWFSPDPVSVPAASGGNTGTATVTATAAGSFSYNSPCLEVGMPIIIIHPIH